MGEIWRKAGASEAILDGWLLHRVQVEDVHCYVTVSVEDK